MLEASEGWARLMVIGVNGLIQNGIQIKKGQHILLPPT